MATYRDLVIVGAGPAGVSAALYARARGIDLCLLEAGQVGGLAVQVSRLSHYTGLVVDEAGKDFAQRLSQQLEQAAVPLLHERAEALRLDEDGTKVLTLASGQELRCRALILAMGSVPKKHPLAAGKDCFSHWAGANEDLEDSRVFVLGGSDGAIKEALYLARRAQAVDVIQIAPSLLCVPEFQAELEARNNIQVHLGADLVAVSSAEHFDLEWLEIREADGQLRRYTAEGQKLHIYTHIGQSGAGGLLEGLLPLEDGFVQAPVETGLAGVYVAGDLRVKPIRQIATAVAEGCEAGIKASQYLRQSATS